MRVKFIKVEDINKFVNFVSKLQGRVYLQSGEVKVNAKSIMGAIYIINEHPDNIVVEAENPEEVKLVLNFLMQGGHLND
ncbi:HPr family phosphocarrier protein [Lutibacter sp. B2]|nr:HPr family phosphocarrier protein [Lutibacter sp. B2]